MSVRSIPHELQQCTGSKGVEFSSMLPEVLLTNTEHGGKKFVEPENFVIQYFAISAFILTVPHCAAVVFFSSHARIFGECSTIHSLPAVNFLGFFVMEIRLCTLIPPLRPGSV